jgi:hypothetical protein
MRIRNKANTNRTIQVPSNTRQGEFAPGILARLDERCEIGYGRSIRSVSEIHAGSK